MKSIPWPAMIQKEKWPKGLWVPEPGCPESEWVSFVEQTFPLLREELAKTPQDEIYHAEGDVWTHTCMVVNKAIGSAAYQGLDESRAGVVFYASLLHDVAKSRTTSIKEGRVISPGHSAKGAVEARRLLWDLGAPFFLREQVCRIIESHQVPFFALGKGSGRDAEKMIRGLSVDRDLELLALVARADMEGRRFHGAAAVLADIDLFEMLAEELGCLREPFNFPDAATRISYLSSGQERSPVDRVFSEDPFEVVMTSGLPASGKDSWCASAGLPIVSFDGVRKDLGLAYGKDNRKVSAVVTEAMKGLLRKKSGFALSATSLSEEVRRGSLKLFREYGATVRIVYLEQSRSVLLARNNQRGGSLRNSTLLSMLDHWEVPGYREAEEIEFHIQGKNLSA